MQMPDFILHNKSTNSNFQTQEIPKIISENYRGQVTQENYQEIKMIFGS